MGILWWVLDVSAYGVHESIFKVILDVYQEIWGRWSSFGISVEYLSSVFDLRDVAIVIITPYLLSKIIYENPIVARADKTPMDEYGVQTVWDRTKVVELTIDIGIQGFDLQINSWTRISILALEVAEIVQLSLPPSSLITSSEAEPISCSS